MNFRILALSIVVLFAFETLMAQSVSNGSILQLQSQASTVALSSVPTSALSECYQRAAVAFAVLPHDVHAISTHRNSGFVTDSGSMQVVLRNNRNNAIANCKVTSKTAAVTAFLTGLPTRSLLSKFVND
jgi:hypothetical protein